MKCMYKSAACTRNTLSQYFLVLASEVGHWMSSNRLKLNADKTELQWAGSRHKLATLGGCTPSLQLGADVIRASDHVRLLSVIIAADLSLDRHVSSVCNTCFFWLRQLNGSVVRWTPSHAFVTSRWDYCNSVLASASKTTDELQRVLNAAARLISCTSKQVRPLSVSTTSRRTALAGHPSASAVQACRDCPPVSPKSSTDVPHRLLCSSVRCCRLPAPAIRQPPSTDCSTCPLQHLRLPFLRFCWSNMLHYLRN